MPIATVTVDHDIREILKEARIFSTITDKSRYGDGFALKVSSMAIIEPYTAFYIGDHLYSMGAFSYSSTNFDPGQKVGRYCSIGARIQNFAEKHPIEHLSTSHFNRNFSSIYRQACIDFGVTDFNATPYNLGPYEVAEIGHDVWIGEDVLLGRNIKIGTGAIIGSRSIVTKDVPPYAIVAGTPAKIIRYRFPEPIIERLLASQWWEYKFTDFSNMPYAEPEKFLDVFEKAKPRLLRFPPRQEILLNVIASGLQGRGREVPAEITHALEGEQRKKTLSASFSVPPDCSTWYDVETDHRDGQPFRFFGRMARLELPVPAAHRYLEFTVPHVVSGKALDQLTVSACGLALLADEIQSDEYGRPKMRFTMNDPVVERAREAGKLDLLFECRVCNVPAVLYPGSHDHRQLSLAVTAPRLLY